jgi:hypothetical protein
LGFSATRLRTLGHALDANNSNSLTEACGCPAIKYFESSFIVGILKIASFRLVADVVAKSHVKLAEAFGHPCIHILAS